MASAPPMALPYLLSQCPISEGAFIFNSTACICPPGLYLTGTECSTFYPQVENKVVAPEWSETYFEPPFKFKAATDGKNIQKWASIGSIMIAAFWILGAFFVHVLPLGDGNRPGGGRVFKMRYFMTRLDRRYHRRHWMDEQKVFIKRRTELGGVCSVASYIATIGLVGGLISSYIVSRGITTQTLVPTLSGGLSEFSPDLQLNYTIVSNLDCSQFLFPPSLVPRIGSVTLAQLGTDRPQIEIANLTQGCDDTPLGPRFWYSIKNASLESDDYFGAIFCIDTPEKPCTSAGIQMWASSSEKNVTSNVEKASILEARLSADGLSSSFVNSTWTGIVPAWLSLGMFPRNFKNDGDLKLMSLSYREYLPGLTAADEETLRELLQLPELRPNSEGLLLLLNMHVFSEYIIQTSSVTQYGILTLLSRIGGLYGACISIFYLLQLQIEIRFRWLAYDDELLAIVSRIRHRRALWAKLAHVWHVSWLFRNLRRLRLRDELEAREQRAALMEKKRRKRGRNSPFVRLLGGGAPVNGKQGEEEWEEAEKAKGEGSEDGDKEGRGKSEEKAEERIEIVSVSASDAASTAPPPQQEQQQQPVTKEAKPRVHFVEDTEGDVAKGANNDDDTKKGQEEKAPQSSSAVPHHRPILSKIPSLGIHMPHTPLPTPHLPRSSSLSRALSHRFYDQLTNLDEENRTYGSNSDYKGLILRDIRQPSWLPRPDPLPAVPPVKKFEKAVSHHGGESAEERRMREEKMEDKEWDEIKNYLEGLHDYNTRLRHDFLAFQTMLEDTVQFFRPHSDL